MCRFSFTHTLDFNSLLIILVFCNCRFHSRRAFVARLSGSGMPLRKGYLTMWRIPPAAMRTAPPVPQVSPRETEVARCCPWCRRASRERAVAVAALPKVQIDVVVSCEHLVISSKCLLQLIFLHLPFSDSLLSFNFLITGAPDRIKELIITPSRVKRSSTSTYNHKRHVFVHKISSDLELSSYVQKAPTQMKSRVNRIF